LNNLSQTVQNNTSIWHNQFLSALSGNEIDFKLQSEDGFKLIYLNDQTIIINLVDINNHFNADDLIFLQNRYQEKNLKLIHLWEDVWITKSSQVLARIKSLLGLNIRIHGRKTKVQKITKPVSDSFLNTFHLQGGVSSRYKLGLFLKDDLIAVATFSALRKMKHTENYRSAELIRFAVKAGYSVTGGLSKLIADFYDFLKPNDLMTYADRDWSAGEAYLRLGFNKTDALDPQFFVLDDQLNRLLKKTESNLHSKEVFNTGSLKYILRF